MSTQKILPGDLFTIGAHWDGEGTHFSLFSAHAEAVELCLFNNGKEHRYPLYQENQIWHGYLPGISPGQQYGYRVHGVWDPQQGLFFNANNLLIVPYAKALSGSLQHHQSHYDCGEAPRNSDNQQWIPKGVVTATKPLSKTPKLETPWHETLLYELHVKGFTQQHPDIPASRRGRFQGLASAPVIKHLKALGVTAVELLPVFAFADEQHLQQHNLTNYWGYNPFNFFAPDPRYLNQPTAIQEFRNMVRKLHDAGIEVILDVVFNHSGEGDALGPTLSLKGIDNLSYYRHPDGHPDQYINDAGCGNTLNLSHPRVIQLVTDSLRYWSQEMEVDGFRFDLATTLARNESNQYTQHSALLAAIQQDSILSRQKLIAEPWDLGTNGYQTGNFPSGWREWNDSFRDDLRAFWNGDNNGLGSLGQRLTASEDLFGDRGRTLQSSINFITAHDGFTLHDLVSYEQKHNLDNGEDNRDGTNHNLSCNHGVEGETDNGEINFYRNQHKRNLLTTLFFSQGVPMLLSGDEMGNSQQGNNNSYCQDTTMSWIDWSRLKQPENQSLLEYVCHLSKIRNQIPHFQLHHLFHSSQYRKIHFNWLTQEGILMEPHHWNDPLSKTLIMLCCTPAPDTGKVALIINGSHTQQQFKLPSPTQEKQWKTLIDSANPRHSNHSFDPPSSSNNILLRAESIALLQESVIDEP